jgi:hypothetical protein
MLTLLSALSVFALYSCAYTFAIYLAVKIHPEPHAKPKLRAK